MTARRWFQQYVRETDFLHRYPFYAGVLAQLDFEATTRVPVMGIRWRDGDYCLLVNEQFFARRPRFRAGVLLHEVHHLVLGHLVRRAFFDVARPDLMQLAMETSANEYIAEALPAPIVWQQFRHVGLGAHQTTLHRYELLVAGRDRIDERSLQQVSRFDDHGGDDDGLGIGIQDLLRGRALPGAAAAKLHVVLRRARSIGRDAHAAVVAAGPERPPRPLRAGALAETLRAHIASTVEPSGLLGRDLDAVIEELAPPPGPPRVDWRSALRAFGTREPGVDWQRPNRRQPHRLLEVPGRTWRGGRPELLVAIDSSGSMGPAELGAVARELVPLAARARITIVECDDAIRRVYPFTGRIDTICGRGGTDLRPPFAPELLRRHGRDGVVYFTDGGGPTPQQPPKVPVLWVLTGVGEEFDCAFGRRVVLPRATDDDDVWNVPF